MMAATKTDIVQVQNVKERAAFRVRKVADVGAAAARGVAERWLDLEDVGAVAGELAAGIVHGEVRSDLPITTHGTTNDRSRHRVLSGTYGDGSAVLELTTFSGSILITKL